MARLPDIAARLAGWPRRVLALCCLLLAAGSAVAMHSSARATPGPQRAVVVAARDLAIGTVLTAADVQVAHWPNALSPPDALATTKDAIGHRLSGAVRAREAVTSTRLVGGDLTVGLPAGLVATAVPIAQGGAAELLRAGDAVDLFVADAPTGTAGTSSAAPTAHVLAEHVRVLSVIPASRDASADGVGAGVVVAVDHATALRLAAAAGRPILAAVRGSP